MTNADHIKFSKLLWHFMFLLPAYFFNRLIKRLINRLIVNIKNIQTSDFTSFYCFRCLAVLQTIALFCGFPLSNNVNATRCQMVRYLIWEKEVVRHKRVLFSEKHTTLFFFLTLMWLMTRTGTLFHVLSQRAQVSSEIKHHVSFSGT